MRIRSLHSWELSPKEAITVQQKLRSRVERENRFGSLRLVAGVDVGIPRGARIARAAVAVLTFPGLEPVVDALAELPLRFPYVPGLLSFREVPVIVAALKKLQDPLDLLLCDAHGLAHPRRFGLACHLGLLTDTPSIGVAKSRLTGTHAEVPAERGRWCPLEDKGEVIGAVLRTRARVKPIYVSIGHRVDLETAIELVLQATPRYRLPETTRRADRLASRRGRSKIQRT
jgi:deoxyribonuclease V